MIPIYELGSRIFVVDKYINLIGKIISGLRSNLNILSFSIKILRKIILYGDKHPRYGVGNFNLSFHSTLKIQWL